MLFRHLYNALLTLLALPTALYLKFHPTYPPLLHRFTPHVPDFGDNTPIWVHAASLGEINTALPLLTAIQTKWPGLPILLTTSTLSGMEQANSSIPSVHLTWFPFDHPISVRQFLNRANPRCLILIETELWPNVLHYTHKANIPIAIVNGRISTKHFARYTRARRFFEPLLNPISLACMQTTLDEERITHMGVAPECIEITGNTKFDGATTQVLPEQQQELRDTLGLTDASLVLIFGSTRPGDEALAAACWASLTEEFSNLRLIIVPRHTKRLQDATSHFANQPILLRSTLLSGEQSPDGERVIFVDTMGELDLFYSLATIAVVGGSFSSNVQGHNPIEPAALGIPTVFGPHMKNFLAPAEILMNAQGAFQVQSKDELLPTLRNLLSNPEICTEMKTRAQSAVRDNRGAIHKTLDSLAPLIEQ